MFEQILIVNIDDVLNNLSHVFCDRFVRLLKIFLEAHKKTRLSCVVIMATSTYGANLVKNDSVTSKIKSLEVADSPTSEKQGDINDVSFLLCRWHVQ